MQTELQIVDPDQTAPPVICVYTVCPGLSCPKT